MSDFTVPGGDEDTVRTTSQSGMQVWLVCALFVLVPVVVILIVKFVFGM